MKRYVFDNLLVERPGMFEDWRQAAKVIASCVLFGLLVWAAIYELVKW